MSAGLDKWVLSGEAVTWNVIVLVLALLAAVCNTVLLVQFYRNRREVRACHMALINISICDCLFGWGSLVSNTAHVLNHELSWEFCQYNGIVTTACLATSGLSSVLMALERYLQVVRSKSFTLLQMTGFLVIIWSLTLFLAIFPVIVKTYHVPDSSSVYCFPDRRGTTLFHYLFSITGFICIVFATSSVTLAYTLIYKEAIAKGFAKFYSRQKQSQSSASENRGLTASVVSAKEKIRDTVMETAYKRQLELTLKLAILTVAFHLAWVATGFNFIYQIITKEQFPPRMDFAAAFLCFANCIFSPVYVLSVDRTWRIQWSRPLSSQKGGGSSLAVHSASQSISTS
ncbi:hypothetical protein BKA69DRAFT_555332 [Paraphysoderma sedebokerense]|nr:hypothetical protein BKA69DRAFT_555332 [Paraphysoderma sedebokerense]